MARPIELRHLRYFVAIAEEGGFTRAAQRLHMQQPPLSQQLQALEAELGAKLFDRLPRGVQLTAAGVALLGDARAILDAVEGARSRVRRVASGVEGTLVIGLASSAATHAIVPRLLAAYRDRHPDVHLQFAEGNAASLTEAVVSGQAHAALVRSPVDRPAGVRFDRLLEEPMLAAVARAHPLAAKAARRTPPHVTLRELGASPFILVRRPGAPGMYGDLIAACEQAGVKAQVAAEVGNMLTNILLVASGVGVSVVPASMHGLQGELVAYLPMRGAGRLVAPLTLITREGESNPALGPFVALARSMRAPK